MLPIVSHVLTLITFQVLRCPLLLGPLPLHTPINAHSHRNIIPIMHLIRTTIPLHMAKVTML